MRECGQDQEVGRNGEASRSEATNRERRSTGAGPGSACRADSARTGCAELRTVSNPLVGACACASHGLISAQTSVDGERNCLTAAYLAAARTDSGISCVNWTLAWSHRRLKGCTPNRTGLVLQSHSG